MFEHDTKAHINGRCLLVYTSNVSLQGWVYEPSQAVTLISFQVKVKHQTLCCTMLAHPSSWQAAGRCGSTPGALGCSSPAEG